MLVVGRVSRRGFIRLDWPGVAGWFVVVGFVVAAVAVGLHDSGGLAPTSSEKGPDCSVAMERFHIRVIAVRNRGKEVNDVSTAVGLCVYFLCECGGHGFSVFSCCWLVVTTNGPCGARWCASEGPFTGLVWTVWPSVFG